MTQSDNRSGNVVSPNGRPDTVPDPVLAAAVRKVKRRTLPLFVLMFVIAYIDRVNVGFVKPHMASDIGIGSAAFGLGAGLFFVGYALFEVPSNIALQRVGARLWLTRIMGSWGMVAMAMAFVQGETSFYVLRFLLGAAEAGFFPGVVFYMTRWLPRSEYGKAMAVFLSGSAIASIVAGPITGALLTLHGGGLAGWQWMFLIEGAAAVCLCPIAWWAITSTPADAAWLSDTEKAALQRAVPATGGTSGGHGGSAIRRVLGDPQILLFCFLYFSISLTIYGVTFWLPTIIRQQGGLGDLAVGMLNSVPWVISVGAMYAFATLAARFRWQQAWAAAALTIAGLGLILAGQLGPSMTYVAICCAAVGFKAASSLFWPIPQSYLDPRIAAAVLALINSLGNLGGFVAPAAFGLLQQRTGTVSGGLVALGVISCVAAALVFLTRSAPARSPNESTAA